MNSKHHGKFVWYDLMTEDMKAAGNFYREVIGWGVQDVGGPGRPYALFSKGAAMVAGLMPIPPEARQMGMRPRWTGYVAVDDVDTYAKRVAAAGGAVHRGPEDIPGIGRFAVASDPHKAIFILFKRARASRRPASMRPKASPASSAGTSSRPAISTQTLPSIPACSAGRRARPSIWGKRAPTSSSRLAARRSAA